MITSQQAHRGKKPRVRPLQHCLACGFTYQAEGPHQHARKYCFDCKPQTIKANSREPITADNLLKVLGHVELRLVHEQAVALLQVGRSREALALLMTQPAKARVWGPDTRG